ncbi:hypothetical protein ACFLRT_01230 [Acidobacteriota bacterium]
MKNILLILVITIMGFGLVNNGFSQEKSQHKPIVEDVQVNWWQVPIFVLDKDGNPIIDLKETDIEVWLNNRRIDDFSLYKRAFTAYKEPGSVTGPLPGEQKKNTIFLLFDVAMSAETCTEQSKAIARQIVSNSEPGIQFIVFTIEPFKGLKYIYGPGHNKKELWREIEKNVKGKPNERLVDIKKFFNINELGNSKRGKGRPLGENRLDYRDKDLLREAAGGYYLRKAISFFDSFETLYLIFNSIQNNKFVYFFTEGISNSVKTNLMSGNALYKYHLEKMAKYLGRSGAVLFILNPRGMHDGTTLITEQQELFNEDIDQSNPYSEHGDTSPGSPKSYLNKEEFRSGEGSLKYLAAESGGKYLEGDSEAIVKTLEHMHRAYYEISFPDLPGLKGITRKITIKPKGKRVSIHSMRSLERNKRYAEMNHIEKEILAVNLVTQNPLMKTLLSSQPARITHIKESKKKVVHTVVLPENFLNQQLDLYKLWIKDNLEVVSVKTEMLVPKKEKIKIQFDKKGKTAPACKPYFALVNRKAETVLVRVIGDEWLEEEPQIAVKPSKAEFIAAEKLQIILDHAAAYCEKLKNSAFHFFCKEKIVESRSPLYASMVNSADIIRVSKDFTLRQYDFNELTEVNTYVFGYRLLKSGPKIKEEREWLSSKDNTPISRDNVGKATAFFSRKAIFAPLTLLARERQNRYNYRFIRYDKRKGRRAVVIEVIPKSQEEENTIYGNVWIDLEDYSMLKIEADPRSIKGYQTLKEIARELNTRLFLTLELEFDNLHDGIRFPTKTHMLERYKGGRFVLKYKGSKGWERNRTTFTYTDYRFFDVKVEVSIDKG